MKTNYKDINGVLILNKAVGASSNKVLQKVRHLYQAKKAGHTGSLDPLASGVLPICFGEATKYSGFLLDANKTYTVKAKLGAKTTTGDLEGELLDPKPVPNFSRENIVHVANSFLGASEQVPSMYSALKYNGQPLYKLARQNINIERPARDIFVYSFELLDQTHDTLSFSIECSKGTYIRNLIEDLGEKLGCGAHVIELQRSKAGNFNIESSFNYEHLQNAENLHDLLLPISTLLYGLNKVCLSAQEAKLLINGRVVEKDIDLDAGLIVLEDEDNKFIGVGEFTADKIIKPHRMMSKLEES